ncbi:MAG: Hsp20/alpha crystallin family protein [Ginsengibacter sp.]
MATRALTTRTGGDLFPSFFDNIFRPLNFWGTDFSPRTLTVPAVNIDKNKDQYELSLAVGGMKKDDFKISLENDILTSSSEKEEKSETKQKNGYQNEFNYSSFSRSFTLPDEVIKDKIDARYEDGVLKLNLPKKEQAKRLTVNKQITVK